MIDNLLMRLFYAKFTQIINGYGSLTIHCLDRIKANQLRKPKPMRTSKFREKENVKKSCSKSQNNYDKQKLF